MEYVEDWIIMIIIENECGERGRFLLLTAAS